MCVCVYSVYIYMCVLCVYIYISPTNTASKSKGWHSIHAPEYPERQQKRQTIGGSDSMHGTAAFYNLPTFPIQNQPNVGKHVIHASFGAWKMMSLN